MKQSIIKCGRGEIIYKADESVYKGDFKDNYKHGRGQHIFKNGDTYSGEWQHDMKHGYGKIELVSSEGLVYYG